MNNTNTIASNKKRLINFVVDGFVSVVITLVILHILARINISATESFINSSMLKFTIKGYSFTIYFSYPLIYVLYVELFLLNNSHSYLRIGKDYMT